MSVMRGPQPPFHDCFHIHLGRRGQFRDVEFEVSAVELHDALEIWVEGAEQTVEEPVVAGQVRRCRCRGHLHAGEMRHYTGKLTERGLPFMGQVIGAPGIRVGRQGDECAG